MFRVGQASSSSRFLPETGTRHIISIFPCQGWGGVFKQTKNASKGHYQLERWLSKQNRRTNKQSITKPTFTRHAGHAGGFLVEFDPFIYYMAELDRFYIFMLEFDHSYLFMAELDRFYIFMVELGRFYIFMVELDHFYIFTANG